MKYEITKLDDKVVNTLIKMSELWEKENCSWGIIKNTKNDLKEPLIISKDENKIVGYIFGHFYTEENKTSYIEIGSKCFMIDEAYVLPDYRSKGIGKELFKILENLVKNECQYITLSTSTKNYKKILHFYIDELDMTFHSAYLIKNVNKGKLNVNRNSR